MTSERKLPADVLDADVEIPEPDEDLWFIDESIVEADLAAQEDERFDEPAKPRRLSRARFYALLAIVLVVHAALIAAFLYRDAHQPQQLAQMQETPVDLVQEPPPEPAKPLPPPPEQKPEPPRPKEDLSPALSAPRAPNEDKVKTPTKEAKTAAPTKMETPTQGQPQAAPDAAPPPKEAPPVAPQKEETAKEEDKTKPDAEALDKARKAAEKAKENKTKVAKAAPRRKAAPNVLAMLSGAPSLDAHMSFARPTPKTKIYGGTEDVRWMSEVEAMLEAKVMKLPVTAHYKDGGKVAICFHVDVSGRVLNKDYCAKSGYPDVDSLAMRALLSAQPFPPPPPGLERGLIWVTTFDGTMPKLHFR